MGSILRGEEFETLDIYVDGWVDGGIGLIWGGESKGDRWSTRGRRRLTFYMAEVPKRLGSCRLAFGRLEELSMQFKSSMLL